MYVCVYIYIYISYCRYNNNINYYSYSIYTYTEGLTCQSVVTDAGAKRQSGLPPAYVRVRPLPFQANVTCCPWMLAVTCLPNLVLCQMIKPMLKC